MILLSDPGAVDLDAHGVIEAHAGTGKTWTIVQLVLRLLRGGPGREPLHIRDIMLVTYTEKAAGELRTRIREALGGANGNSAHLRACQANMHEAMIGTIHAVCLRILRSWPFDSGVQSGCEPCDDDQGLEEAILRQVRGEWQDPAGPVAPVLDRLRGYGKPVDRRFLGLVAGLAKELLAGPHARLATQGAPDLCREVLARQAAEDAAQAAAWRDLEAWLADYRDAVARILLLDLSAGQRADLKGKLATLEAAFLAKDIRDKAWDAPASHDDHVIFRKSAKLVKDHPVLHGEFLGLLPARLAPVIRRLRAPADLSRGFLEALACDAAAKAARDWQAEKARRGLVSFADMLRLARDAVATSPSLVARLRERVRVAIIDEFQDTSALQWDIFRRVFLEDDRPSPCRLLLVGDPKQSIYAFQGADVGTYATARRAVAERGGKLYGLVRNFRSLPEVVAACNTILGREAEGADWFGHQAITYPGEGPGGCLALAAERPGLPPSPVPPFQAVVVTGKADERRRQLAAHASLVIRSLVGTTVPLPDGASWRPHVLAYADFAIIVERHNAARPFLERLAADGIPATKYKLEGVFQSDSCRALRAVLRAVVPGAGPDEVLAALLTPFFALPPAALDPAGALDPAAPHMRLLAGLGPLAKGRRWGRLFARLLEDTGVRERLVRLEDGERRLADLRQAADHCLERLVAGNWDLGRLVAHLGALLAGRETLADDRNVHALASEKAAVRVLTMHASKGLEFPVVFVVTGSGDDPLRPPVVRAWNEDGGGIVVSPQFPKDPLPGLVGAQHAQERRRLVYVALTRPQVALFAPVHLDAAGKAAGRGLDADLSPRLQELVAAGRLPLFDRAAWEARPRAGQPPPVDHLEPGWAPDASRSAALAQELEDLGLSRRRSLQTSYTELSRGQEVERSLSPAEESGGPDAGADGPAAAYAASRLPRGADTGDALHQALEACIDGAPRGGADLDALLRRHLAAAGVLRRLERDAERDAAVAAACRMVRLGLESPLDLGRWGVVSLAPLLDDPAAGGCRAEVEFQVVHRPHGPDWLHGFMDAVFRLPDPANPRHPWRYHVLDWKTDSLARYDAGRIAASVVERHYDLQARLYCHALHRFLDGLLGADYRPAANLGCAAYVYLRGLEEAAVVPVWRHDADPAADADFVEQQVARWKRRRPA